MPVDPFLLLRCAHTDEYNIRLGFGQHLDNTLILFLVVLETVGGRITADNVHAGISRL
ncbi:hypothetical protein D3C71_2065750 [compost metagenome]